MSKHQSKNIVLSLYFSLLKFDLLLISLFLIIAFRVVPFLQVGAHLVLLNITGRFICLARYKLSFDLV